MADTGAERQRRYKAHKAGNHQWCRHLASVPAVTVSVPTAGSDDLDPVVELAQLAGDALAAYRADRGNAQLLREARMTLQALMGVVPVPDVADPVAFLRELSGQVP